MNTSTKCAKHIPLIDVTFISGLVFGIEHLEHDGHHAVSLDFGIIRVALLGLKPEQ